MEYQPPNGYFARDFIVYGSLEKGGSISRGFRLFPPDLSGASEQTLAEIHGAITRYLQAVPLHQRDQWQWRKSSDYRDALDRYDAETAKFTNPDARRLREHTSKHFREMAQRRELHREHLEIYPTLRIAKAGPAFASRASLKEFFKTQLDHFETAFQQIQSELSSAFGNELVIEPMNREDHYLTTFLWYNPDFMGRPADLLPHFDASRSIHWNCKRSDISTTKAGRLYYGGNYHGILVLRLMGSHTGETMMHHITKAAFVGYQVTVCCTPLDTQKVIQRHEAEARSLQLQEVDEAQKKGVSSAMRQATIEMKSERVRELSRGHTRLFNVTLVIHAWADNEATLASRISALKQAVINMKNAQVYDQHLPASALDLLYCTLPGNGFHPYDSRAIEIEDHHLANFLPFSASFTGDLANAQALCESADRSLTGIRFNVHGQPQHTGILGGTGTGKSTTYRNFMFQTADYFDFDVIVESGLWHADYTRSYKCEPIVVKRDGNVSLNYLDTGGLPLSAEHIGLAVTQTLHMAGHVSDERLQNRRKTYLTYYLRQLYQEAFENWQRKNGERVELMQREAAAVHRWQQQKMNSDDTLLMAYADLRDRVAAQDAEALEFVSKLSERDVTEFVTNRETAHLATGHVFAYFTPEEYPRHAELVDLLSMRPDSQHNAADVSELAELLRNWTADQGAYGPFFDGVTNRSLNARVVHFENGAGDRTDTTLKQAAALTIAGKIRQRIIQLPRALPKRFTWEELAADLDVPQNDKLIAELAAQFRKFNCAFVYLIQNYSQFSQSAICSPLLSNTAQYILHRQEDSKDVADLAPRIGLPESLRDAVTKFPRVVNLPANNRYAKFCYFSKIAYPPIAGAAILHPRQVGESIEPSINRHPSKAA